MAIEITFVPQMFLCFFLFCAAKRHVFKTKFKQKQDREVWLLPQTITEKRAMKKDDDDELHNFC